MRFGAVVDSVGAFETGMGWPSGVENLGELRAGGDEVVAVGEVDPPFQAEGVSGRMLEAAGDGMQAEGTAKGDHQGQVLGSGVERFVGDHGAETMGHYDLG